MKAVLEIMLLKSLNPIYVGRGGSETEWDRMSDEEKKDLLAQAEKEARDEPDTV